MAALTLREKATSARLEVGVASHPMAPQTECGDAWAMERVPDGFVIAAIDGLGHGRDAARASRCAVAAIGQSATGTLEEVLMACHRALMGSRGAAISLARIELAAGRLAWLGVGNVEGLVLSPVPAREGTWRSETLVVRGGVVGYDLPHLQTAYVPFGLGSVLVFATDGLRQGFSSGIRPGRHPQEIADQIMGGYDRGTDDALVLVVRSMRSGSRDA